MHHQNKIHGVDGHLKNITKVRLLLQFKPTVQAEGNTQAQPKKTWKLWYFGCVPCTD